MNLVVYYATCHDFAFGVSQVCRACIYRVLVECMETPVHHARAEIPLALAGAVDVAKVVVDVKVVLGKG